MYKIKEDLLIEFKTTIDKLLEELWLTSELTPEEFQRVSAVIIANSTLKTLNDEYGI